MEKDNIGCKICRQEGDDDCIISCQEYDAGWLGTVETSVALYNETAYMKGDGKYYDNNTAILSYHLWQNKPHNDEPFFREEIEIRFCPFCGANLKEVRDHMRILEDEQDWDG